MSNRTCARRPASLAVIPARGGSKRIPKKNIRSLCGKPVIAYTIEAAIQSSLFSKIIVSTDSEETAATARAHGAEVPFMREGALADDHTPVSLVAVDVLEKLDQGGDQFDLVAQLLPNCPLRTSEDVVDSYRQFTETGAESQVSVTRFGWLNPWWAVTRDRDYRLSAVHAQHLASRSQDLPEVFCPTGAVWWAKSEVLRSERTFHTPYRTGWEIPWQRAVDIDTEDDWYLAELLMLGQVQQ